MRKILKIKDVQRDITNNNNNNNNNNNFARLNSISQRLVDQARTILNKGLFSDLEIHEIYQQMNREEYQQNRKI